MHRASPINTVGVIALRGKFCQEIRDSCGHQILSERGERAELGPSDALRITHRGSKVIAISGTLIFEV